MVKTSGKFVRQWQCCEGSRSICDFFDLLDVFSILLELFSTTRFCGMLFCQNLLMPLLTTLKIFKIKLTNAAPAVIGARLFRSAVNITSASQPISLQKVTATNCGWPTILRIQHPNYNQRPLSIYSKCMQIAWCIVKKTSISIYHMLQKSVKEFAILSWELFCCLK